KAGRLLIPQSHCGLWSIILSTSVAERISTAVAGPPAAMANERVKSYNSGANACPTLGALGYPHWIRWRRMNEFNDLADRPVFARADCFCNPLRMHPGMRQSLKGLRWRS